MSSVPTYSAPPRRAGAGAGSDSSSASAYGSFSSFGRSSRADGGAGGFGGGHTATTSSSSSRNEFDSAASAAFGKKPARTFEELPPAAAPPKVTPARNTLASILDSLLPPEPENKEREWSRSALKQQRKAAVDAERSKPAPKKSYEEEFPTLGGAGGGTSVSVRVPKPVFDEAAETGETKQTGSFASLAANWAKSEEERKAAEAIAARLRLEQQQRDDYEHSQRTQFYFNRNANRQHNGYEDEPYNNGNGYSNGEDDEYVEGELGEDVYTEKDRRVDLRTAANHYSDEEEDDHVDHNFGSTAW